jgi:tetratricopeptide (TPR) repeat protein
LELLNESTIAAEDIEARLLRIERLLGSDPASADAEAAELLAAAPGHALGLLFRGIARRLCGDPSAAIGILGSLCKQCPDAPLPHLQLGLAQREAGDLTSAAGSIRKAVAIQPGFTDAWLALADLLTVQADGAGADHAFGMYVRHADRDPRLRQPAAALRANRIDEAASMLQQHLAKHPTDVVAMNMLADAALRRSNFDVAERLLRNCLQLAPGYRTARHNYAVVLMRLSKPADALQEIRYLLAQDPTNRSVRVLHAAVLIRLAEFDEAIGIYEDLAREQPSEPGIWASLGHALRTVGRLDACVAAYRRAIAAAPHFGEAYWNLANLKTLAITDAELEAMRLQLARPDLGGEDRIHFSFAIGKALEDKGEFEESFRHYDEGNRLRRRTFRYDASEMTDHVRRCRELFTREFFATRKDSGLHRRDPIFVVGLPRAGSTLVEQILASHSAVEGTMELPHLMGVAMQIGAGSPASAGARYPELLATLDLNRFRDLAGLYLERIGSQRKRGAQFFVDKMPNNFAHLGLIQLMFPDARIIDVRRHPMACGWSLFRHHFAHGQYFSYSLKEIGQYYRNYATLMDHFDAVLPGRVHRMIYESLVDDTEGEIRRLLEYCGLPFEESCLDFHRNRRAVSTPSSEQVRRPIFRHALDQWRHYEAWLGPLSGELGTLTTAYPRTSS